ncbi:MBOAT, membrane-bound O-acyltransferase family-domain-containing protein [Syncephalis plumigaleata]|nr:MBOAT, membrane-bound O-acyltransferase family-domain-containing protein [Syncephalis plumigaleata]
MSLGTELERLADALGFPVADLRLSTSVILMYGAGFLFNCLPHSKPAIKHLFSISLATLLHAYVLAHWLGLMHMGAAAGIAYFLIGTIRHKSMPQIVMLLAMLHLSYTHIARMDEQNIMAKTDFSAAHMILVIKLTSFAFNVHDGRQDEKKLSEYQKQKRITEMPSLLEYYGYVFYFGSFLVGPALEFMDYRNFCTMEVFKTKDNKIHCPSGLKASLECILQSVTAAGVLLVFGSTFSITYCLDKQYRQASFLYKFFYLQLASVVARMKYYFVWKISEGTCILSGLAFNGYNAHGQAQWNRVINIRIMDYELAESPRTALDSWNIGTNRWLRNYVYLRLASPDKKSTLMATVATFAASAIWHGFYAGYYLTFASGALMTSVARLMRRTFRPIVAPNNSEIVSSPSKRIYDILGWFITQTTINYIAAPFQLLSFSASLSVWHSNAYVIHIAMIAMYFWLLYAGGARWVRNNLWPASTAVLADKLSSEVVMSTTSSKAAAATTTTSAK